MAEEPPRGSYAIKYVCMYVYADHNLLTSYCLSVLFFDTIHPPPPISQKTIYKMTQISKQWLIFKKSQLQA